MAFVHNSEVAKNEPAWGSVDKTKLPDTAFADEKIGVIPIIGSRTAAVPMIRDATRQASCTSARAA